MADISVRNLKKSFEVGKNVLDGLCFDVAAGEHIGILGINGCGKTTLFRIMVGEIEADEGSVYVAGGKRLGLISQIPNYPLEWTTEDVLKEAHTRLRAAATRLGELAKKMETDHSDALLNEYGKLSDWFTACGGYDMETERNKVANGLGISAAMRKRRFDLLSGGERTRVNLARLILEDADILLLDEPTNHLDMNATEWLENFITRFKGTVLVISHDRYFLDAVAKRCVEIRDGKAELYSGNYSFFVEERQRRFDEQLKLYEKNQAKIDQLTEAAKRLHLWAFMGNDALHKSAFSIEKRIEKLAVAKRPSQTKALKATFKGQEFLGDELMLFQNVSKSFGDKQLFKDVSLLVTGGERIALIGDNGAGKSTLVKIITGEQSADSGVVRLGASVKVAYFPQIVSFEDESRSAVDTLLYETKMQPQEVRDRLGAFGFSGEDALKPVGKLSGGEKSRLRLCMIMKSNVNLLILDEPTNHLDIASREWIERALESYDEAILFVSHDRYFIEKFATRIWTIEQGGLTDFEGGFKQYREFRKRQSDMALAAKHKEAKPQKSAKKPPTINLEKLRLKVEAEIEKVEAEIVDLNQKTEQFSSDYIKLMEIEKEREILEARLDELYQKWGECDE